MGQSSPLQSIHKYTVTLTSQAWRLQVVVLTGFEDSGHDQSEVCWS